MKHYPFFTDAKRSVKLPIAGIIAMAILMIVIVTAGCTDTTAETSEPSDIPVVTPSTVPAGMMQTNTVIPVPTPTGCAYPPLNPWTWVPESYTPAATTKLPPAPGTLVSKADLYGTPLLQWDEYQTQIIMDSAQSEGTDRTEFRDHDYAGNPAILENFTYTIHVTGTGVENPVVDTVMDDYYYDAYGNMISAHRRYIRGGEFLENREIPPVNQNRGSPDCSGDIYAPRYKYLGSEPVTVPAGSYPDAMKYTDNDDENSSGKGTETATYWFATGVPVPIMRKFEEPGVVHTLKLTGWG
jgi:hypothetical protein